MIWNCQHDSGRKLYQLISGSMADPSKITLKLQPTLNTGKLTYRWVYMVTEKWYTSNILSW